jgi:hypothetical protein
MGANDCLLKKDFHNPSEHLHKATNVINYNVRKAYGLYIER